MGKIRKVFSMAFYTLAVLSVLLLVKTEARKWLVMEGEATSANQVMFWISLGFAVLFGFLGTIVSETPKTKKQEDAHGKKYG